MTLHYDDHDVLECLGALPQFLYDDYPDLGAWYQTENDGLVLRILFIRYDGCIEITLTRSGQKRPLVNLVLFVRGRIERKSETYADGTWRDWLEFSECVIGSSRYERPSEKEPGRVTVELSAYPQIELQLTGSR